MTEEAPPHVVVKKQLRLQDCTGAPLSCTLRGLEQPRPYTLSLVLDGRDAYGRIDILKHELADELTAWLAGKALSGKPALLIPKRIDEAMLNFLKFGRPPAQADIYLWILSRTTISRNGSALHLVFGQVSSDGTLANTSGIVQDLAGQPSASTNRHSTDMQHPSQPSQVRHSTHTRRHSADSSNPFLGTQKGAETFKLTKEILGGSSALSKLPTQKVKGRAAARPTFIRLGWTEDHYRLTNDISTRRHEVEDIMEQRRKVLEVSKARQLKTTNTYRRIREGNAASRSNYNWARDASYEVMNLDRITATISEDIQRQKCQTERTTEHIRWTMAPNGFVNRRGRYSKGLVLGPGPLPADATSGLKDPRLEKTLRSYHWDLHGRRQLRRPEDVTPGSDIERALCLLKKAATNSSLYKLNLKKVFEDMDMSGDGFVSLDEMRCFLAAIGLKMEDRLIDALFRHFDPNDSGSIHYGEFCWAFFNRRSLIAQWKQNTKTLNDRQIKEKLQQADRNGNGILSRKEFVKLLKSFHIKQSDLEIDLLIDRFDKDGDGELDLDEFTAFINAEVNPGIKQAEGDTQLRATASSSRLGGSGVRTATSTAVNNADERKEHDDIDDFDEETLPSFQDDDCEELGDGDSTYEIRLSSQSQAPPGGLNDSGKTSVADYNISGSVKLADVVNPAELSQIFAHQAKIEAKLGAKYFK